MATAPDPGHYDSYSHDTMAANAAVRRQSMGAFGGRSARSMPWQQEEDYAAGGQNEAPVPSTFSTPRSASPSAAFATSSKSRFADAKDCTPGPGAYHGNGQRSPLGASNRLNRSSSFGGRAKRFGLLKEDETPAPGAFEAKPGAFSAVAKRPSSPRAGFGSRSSRGSPFGRAADTELGPAPGAYDSHAAEGAFARASSPRRNGAGSAAFASRSSRFGRGASGDASAGPDPTAYNGSAYGTMAHKSGKTFNKRDSHGGGGFGTSAARPDWHGKEATPGPGAYAREEGSARGRASSPRPSSAFASRTGQHEAYHRKTDSPATTAYDAHRGSGIAADAAKSFNRLAGSARGAGFGARAARPLERVGHDVLGTPAPGAYTTQDPARPTTAQLAAPNARSRAAPTAFSSTETRDTARWTGATRE